MLHRPGLAAKPMTANGPVRENITGVTGGVELVAEIGGKHQSAVRNRSR